MEKISKKSRHIRWNWEPSPENPKELVRYHFVIVDDRGRKKIRNQILEQIQKITPGIEVIREGIEGRVMGTRLRYLFSTYDTVIAPEPINLYQIGKPVKRDFELRERIKKGFNVEDYVANLYEK